MSWLVVTQEEFRHTEAGRLVEAEERKMLEHFEPGQVLTGYSETFSEILQQPETWRYTGEQLYALIPQLRPSLQGISNVVLSGSGSSEFIGECVAPALQRLLKRTVKTVSSGNLLTSHKALVPLERPSLMVSFGRSGDSPESVGALSHILDSEPLIRHLVLTCNASGHLAVTYRMDPRVAVIVLHERTNDRSLVMTSSFTNLALAALALGMLDDPEAYLELSKLLSESAPGILEAAFRILPELGRLPFTRVFYLASASHAGAARESALKMMEMTAGRVMTAAETYLGLRHGPMSAVHPNTLVVCYLSSEPVERAYECDLIEELQAKKLGMRKLLVGSNIPPSLCAENDVCIESAAFGVVGDAGASMLHVLVGQVLAFYRCLQEGLHPDSPSDGGVIHRVVQSFTLHGIVSGSANEKHSSDKNLLMVAKV